MCVRCVRCVRAPDAAQVAQIQHTLPDGQDGQARGQVVQQLLSLLVQVVDGTPVFGGSAAAKREYQACIDKAVWM